MPTDKIPSDVVPRADDAPGAPLAAPTQVNLHATSQDVTGSLPSSELPPAPIGPAPKFAGFVVLATLGRGGMGVVYKARHVELDRLVALKTIRLESAFKADSLDRFRREAFLLAKLNNPLIVTIYDIQSEATPPFFTMEYVGGGTLYDHRGRFREPRKAIAIVAQIARAVQYAHDQGILHRDLKPQNVLLDENERPKVSDFGLAKLYEGDCELTQSGETLGTPAYMAPEQAAGKSALVGPATDLWALGVILFELLTGERPFLGQNREEILQKILNQEVAFPNTPQSRLDPSLETILRKCLEKSPDARYATAQALASDLEAWLKGVPLSVRPPSGMRRLVNAVSLSYLALGVAVVALVVAVAVWRGLREPPAPTRTDPPEVLADYKQLLAAGKPVELLGAANAPAWYRWTTETHRPAIVPTRRPFNLVSPSVCLLELWPDGTARQFRVHAEVRENTAPGGEVGIYFAHTPHVTAKGLEHWFAVLSFSEPDKEKSDKHAPRFKLLRYREVAANVGQVYMKFDVMKGLAIEANSKKWRDLDVKITPERIEVSWEGKLLEAVDAKKLNDAYAAVLPLADPGKEPPPVFNASGGMGLYVNRADASFRNVAITPVR